MILNRALWLVLLASLPGCIVPTPSTTTTTGTPSGTTGDTGTTGTTGDTGTPLPEGTCPAGVELLTVYLCVETTAPQSTPTTATTYNNIQEASGTGTVTEVGGALAPVAGSARFASFDTCDSEHTQQVRLVDGDGATWTFGWGIDGDIDDGSADSFLVGETLDFLALFRWQPYSSNRAVLLSDLDGPRFLYETYGALSDEQRGGVSTSVHDTDPCTTFDQWGEIEHYLVDFTAPEGTVSLYSGQQTTFDLPSGETSFTLASSYWYVDCSDSCGETLWTAWETP